MTSAAIVLYFAYGSNMLFARIRERVFSVKRIGVAALRGYKLRWHKVSVDGSGKCNVVPSGDNGATFTVFCTKCLGAQN